MSAVNSAARPRPPQARFDIDHGALFDGSALAYDQFRPGYPDAVMNELASLSGLGPGARILEVGCGTGQATVALARRGFSLDCVDPGRNLVSVARKKCLSWPRVRFFASRFEEAALEPGAYDLVFSAQAFHWVRPSIRMRKAACLLRAGGSLALLYNFPAPTDDEAMDRLSRLIQRESGGLLTVWKYSEEVQRWVREIKGSGLFNDLSVCRHSWRKRYAAAEYAGLFRTYSDFLSLPVALQERVAECITGFIERHGGSICRPYDTLLIHARMSASAPMEVRRAGNGLSRQRDRA
ncbi:MAG TPA: class I SAM-dependent methyltransferase [Spirochaetia bacterium]|nr:class I SAM-dependent methyltransferase [Spirochaetia bacterium]